MKYHLENLLEKLKNKKVAFLGVARTNLPLIKLLLKYKDDYNIKLLALDKSKTNKDADIRYLTEQGVNCRLGEDYLKKLDMDVIFRSPGVYYSKELEEIKKQNNIEITSEIEEFFKIHPCKIIAITGSDGKTTTTTLISEILKENGYRVHIGGNIGTPLLHTLENIKPEDFAVVELSSFQLISMQNSPDIAVLTNISPNHLDIHKNMDEYVSAKENILIHQKKDSLAVLNKETSKKYNLQNLCKGKVLFFSTNIKEFSSEIINTFESKAGDQLSGAIEIDGKIYFVNNKVKDFIIERSNIKLKGQHNTENILAAICATYHLVGKDAIKKALIKFKGIPHRLEFVTKKNGVTYINDSIATTPTRTIKGALSVFNKKIILIAGGYDKNISFGELGLEIINKVKLLILIGQTSEKIANSVKKAVKDRNSPPGTAPGVVFVNNLESAVNAAKVGSEPGDVVVLSPACASFGLFKNFQERGDRFKELVSK